MIGKSISPEMVDVVEFSNSCNTRLCIHELHRQCARSRVANGRGGRRQYLGEHNRYIQKGLILISEFQDCNPPSVGN